MTNLYQNAVMLFNEGKFEQAKEIFLKCIAMNQEKVLSMTYIVKIVGHLNNDPEKKEQKEWIGKIAYYYQHEFCS